MAKICDWRAFRRHLQGDGPTTPNLVTRSSLSAVAIVFASMSWCTHATPPTPALDADYGHSVIDPNLRLGGYVTLRIKDLKDEPIQFDLRDVSLFAAWTPTPRLTFLSELKVQSALAISGGRITTADGEGSLERMYIDYAATPLIALRVGKFLTPIGRWNLSHADPLEWTISRPLVTVLPFATRATGISMHGAVPLANGNVIDYTLYLDDSKALDPLRDDIALEDIELAGVHNAFDNAAGGQLRVHFWEDRAELGASYSNAQISGLAERNHLFSIDGRYFWRHIEFSTELVYRYSEGHRENSEWGGFLQTAVPIANSLHAVFRYEEIGGDANAIRARLGTVGLAYRPLPSLVFKIEYRLGQHNAAVAPDGALVSASVLF